MKYRNLGLTGMKMSQVGIGCNNFGRRCDQRATDEVVDAAIDLGVNFFDTADVYGGQGLSEEFLGNAIAKKDRSSIVVATKFANPMGESEHQRGASRRYIMGAVEDSLRRLKTDYIDLYQQHVPDVSTPIDETLRALDDLVSQGKVRYIGHSNFNGWQLADADWTARSRNLAHFVTAQSLYSLMDRRLEREVIPACERFGIGLLPYFPLASGLLTGKYTRGAAAPEGTRLAMWGERGQAALSEDNFDIVEQLTSYAEQQGHSILELAFGWLLTKPYISCVIAGATSASQVKSNVDASEWELTEEQMTIVNDISKR